MQYLEAIRKLKASGFEPVRSVYVTFVPDEEIGGAHGVGKLVESEIFKSLNIAIVLDEGKYFTHSTELNVVETACCIY